MSKTAEELLGLVCYHVLGTDEATCMQFHSFKLLSEEWLINHPASLSIAQQMLPSSPRVCDRLTCSVETLHKLTWISSVIKHFKDKLSKWMFFGAFCCWMRFRGEEAKWNMFYADVFLVVMFQCAPQKQHSFQISDPTSAVVLEVLLGHKPFTDLFWL